MVRWLSLAGVVAVGFAMWWAFIRPAQRMMSFCEELRPGHAVLDVVNRAQAAEFRIYHSKVVGLVVFVHNGSDVAACHVAHYRGFVMDAKYRFP